MKQHFSPIRVPTRSDCPVCHCAVDSRCFITALFRDMETGRTVRTHVPACAAAYALTHDCTVVDETPEEC